MKNIHLNCLLVFCFLLLLMACQKDNYEAPKASLRGRILDAETNKSVPQQTINGGQLQLFQTDLNENPVSINSTFHSDGSYANNMLFDGNYKIIANGPFFYDDTLRTVIRGATNLDIKVRPFLHVETVVSEVTATWITIRMKVNLGQNNTKQKIARVGGIIGTSNSLDINFFTQRLLTNTESQANNDVVVKEYVFTFSNLLPNTTYYIRGVGRTINTGNLYNYAPLLEVKTIKK